MKPTPIIAVIGDARLPAGDPREVFAEDLGRRIIDAGWRLQTGDRWLVKDLVSPTPPKDPHGWEKLAFSMPAEATETIPDAFMPNNWMHGTTPSNKTPRWILVDP